MQVASINMDRDKARELYRAYKTHVNYERPEDYEIMRTYQLIAQGHVVVQALESIKQAGLDEKGLPRLAIVRADNKWCYFSRNTRGGGEFSGEGKINQNSRNTFKLQDGFFPRRTDEVSSWRRAKAIVPMIPPQHRPKRGLDNYHILWEAEWESVPVDPYLLRRIGNSDMWTVLAAWDLTPVEQSVMKTKMLMM